MKGDPLYARLLAQMATYTDDELVADLLRFCESFADHDADCPAAPPPHGVSASELVYGRDAELPVCACGYARRFDLVDEVRRRLVRNA